MIETELRELLAESLRLLQRHPSAEESMGMILTADFETGLRVTLPGRPNAARTGIRR